MSIILKGIDLPKEGEVKFIAIKGKTAIETYKGINVGYYSAIQIPKDHGDIKDINTFLKDKCLTEYIEGDVFNKKYTYTISTIAIYNAPTILEAEE